MIDEQHLYVQLKLNHECAISENHVFFRDFSCPENLQMLRVT